MDRDKTLISKQGREYLARYPGTNLYGQGDTIDEAIDNLEEIIDYLNN